MYSNTIGIDEDSVCSSRTENMERQKIKQTTKKERKGTSNFLGPLFMSRPQKYMSRYFCADVVARGENGGDRDIFFVFQYSKKSSFE